MARTITNPSYKSSLVSSTIRTELQALETEIADVSLGHTHNGSDSRGVIAPISVNGLVFTSAATGFTIYGGTIGKTLTMDVSLTASSIVTLTGLQTLTNKTLSSPVMTSPTLGIASATSLNGLTLSALAEGLSIAGGTIPHTFVLDVDFTASHTVSSDTCVLLTTDQTVAGIKTFTSIPVLPASDPTTDNQSARKAYVDAKSPLIKTGNTTHDVSVTGTQTIAHGLGRVPKITRIRACIEGIKYFTHGTYDGTNQLCLVEDASGSPNYTGARNDCVIYYVVSGGANDAKATISVDATNITLTWSKDSSPTGTADIIWEVMG